MSRRAVICAVLATAALAPPAHGATFGSKLRGQVNTSFGCESVPRYDTFSNGLVLEPTGMRTCTWMHTGYINDTSRNGSLVPATGRVNRVRVRSGANPARVQVTILTASFGIDSSGREIAGTFSCCTAVRHSRPFRLRPNATTTRRVNLRVERDTDREAGQRYTDVVALTAVGPGTLPVQADGTSGALATGAPLAAFWYPRTEIGDPRVEASSMDGLDLMFQWRFRRRSSRSR